MATEFNGIVYFPTKATFFEGAVSESLEAKYGIKGPYLVIKILCKIYKEGYYIQWDEEQCEIFAYKLGREYTKEEVDSIIGILIEKGFFDKNSYEEHRILTSVDIQRVWLEATSRRKRDLTKLPYLLEEVKCKEEEIKCKQKAGECGRPGIARAQVQRPLPAEEPCHGSPREDDREREVQQQDGGPAPQFPAEQAGQRREGEDTPKRGEPARAVDMRSGEIRTVYLFKYRCRNEHRHHGSEQPKGKAFQQFHPFVRV